MDNFDLKAYLRNNTLLKESLEEASEYSKKEQSILDSVKGEDVYDAIKDSIDSSESLNLTQLESILDKAGYIQDDINKILGEVKTEGYGKMKKSELKEKIREEILEALSLDIEKDNEIADEEEAHSGVAEAEGDEEDAPEADIDVDVDAELDIEEPADETPEEDPFGDVEDDVEGAEKEAYDAIIAAGRAYKKLGEDPDNGGLKTMMDQLTYLERSYDYPPKEDVFNTDGEI